LKHKPDLSFDEDSFDLNKHKTAAMNATQKKIRAKLSRRQVWVGRRIVAAVALVLFALLWYLVHTLIS